MMICRKKDKTVIIFHLVAVLSVERVVVNVFWGVFMYGWLLVSFLCRNMKLRLRYKRKTLPFESTNETSLKMLKLQAQDCFNIVLVSRCYPCAGWLFRFVLCRNMARLYDVGRSFYSNTFRWLKHELLLK